MKQLRAEGIAKGKPIREPRVVVPTVPDVELPSRLMWVTHAFVALSRTRLVVETGPQPITFSEIAAYSDLMCILGEEDRRDLMFFMVELDIIYLKHMHLKIQKGRESAADKARRDADRNKTRRR